MKSTVIFDLDGTLTDSGPGIMGCFRKTIEAHGIEWNGPLEIFIGPSAEEWPEILMPNHSETEKTRFVRDYRCCYDRVGRPSRVNPAFCRTLRALVSR